MGSTQNPPNRFGVVQIVFSFQQAIVPLPFRQAGHQPHPHFREQPRFGRQLRQVLVRIKNRHPRISSRAARMRQQNYLISFSQNRLVGILAWALAGLTVCRLQIGDPADGESELRGSRRAAPASKTAGRVMLEVVLSGPADGRPVRRNAPTCRVHAGAVPLRRPVLPARKKTRRCPPPGRCRHPAQVNRRWQ